MFENSIAHQARTRPDALAIISPIGSRSYKQFHQDILRLQTRFIEERQLKGVVAISIMSPVDHWTVVFAITRMGLTTFSLAPAEVAPLEDQLSGLDVDWVVADRSLQLSGKRVVELKPNWRATIGEDMSVPTFAAATAVDFIARIATSSGSTGKPKPIALSRDLIDTRIKNTIQLGPIGARLLAMIGVDAWGGFFSPLLSWATGGCVAFPSVDTRWPELLSTIKPDLLILAPIQLAMIVKQLPPTFFPYGPLQIVVAGGAVPPNLVQLARSTLSAQIFITYASNECGFSSFGHIGLTADKAGAAGYVLPWGELEIVGEDGTPVAPGEMGEIRTRGEESVQSYYLQNTGGDEFRDGWFYPGDVGTLSEDGYLTVMGRTAEVMNCGGIKITPLPIEAALLNVPGVKDVGVVALPQPDGFEWPVAALVTDPQFQRRLAEDAIKPFGHAVRIIQVDEIPRTTGLAKIKRMDLKRKLLALSSA